MLQPIFKKNDRKAKQLIWVFSGVVFLTIVLLGNYSLNIKPGFDIHIFAQLNAFINALNCAKMWISKPGLIFKL